MHADASKQGRPAYSHGKTRGHKEVCVNDQSYIHIHSDIKQQRSWKVSSCVTATFVPFTKEFKMELKDMALTTWVSVLRSISRGSS